MVREAGTQVSAVIMSYPSPKTAAPPCLPLGIRDPLKEGLRLWAFAFCFWGLLLWGFLVWEAFGREKIAEGKRIAGEELLKGNY
jgi:hypothetical protein